MPGLRQKKNNLINPKEETRSVLRIFIPQYNVNIVLLVGS